jgi:ATP-dependent DNA helicase DinG
MNGLSSGKRIVGVPLHYDTAALPMPSLENPSGSPCKDYKQLRQDWFRLYLLPDRTDGTSAGCVPVRSARGLVAAFR